MLAETRKRFYCICFSIRSGSTLLCDDLTQWQVGAPTEWFHVGDPFLAEVHLPDHLVALAQTLPLDCFGFKISWDQAYELTRLLREDGDQSVRFDLRTVFPDLRYIHVVRRDKIGQAISQWRAQLSGTWHVPVGTDASPGYPEYDFEAIKPHLQQTLAEDWLWQSHFEQAGIQPLTITYEDYVNDRVGHLNRIVDFLGVSSSPSPLADRLRIMRDGWTEGIAERFQADLYKMPDPLLVRSIFVPTPEADNEIFGAEPAVSGSFVGRRLPAPFEKVPPIAAPVAVAVGVSAIDALLTQVTLSPLLVTAPLVAGVLVPPRRVIFVVLLAVILTFPLGLADDIADSLSQIWIVAGILVAGLVAAWISRNRVSKFYGRSHPDNAPAA
jgi:trehalose 2-sulfotransferase